MILTRQYQRLSCECAWLDQRLKKQGIRKLHDLLQSIEVYAQRDVNSLRQARLTVQ